MGLGEDVARLSEQVRQRMDMVSGEQATKQSLILPFLTTMGYDIYDPSEVIPEYVADFAIRRAGQFEKVDYAISVNGKIVILIEAKDKNQKPEAHDGQLRKYFNSLLSAKVGIVTNGIEYRFFTDLKHVNVMDTEPFFTFNVLEYSTKQIEELTYFHRENFDATAIAKQAEEMVYVKAMTTLIGGLLRNPSDTFMRFLIRELEVFDGVVNANVVKKFEPIIKKGLQTSLVEMMTRSLNQEMSLVSQPGPVAIAPEPIEDLEPELVSDSQVETTEEELRAFERVVAIVKTSQDYWLEVKYKDVVSYFGLHLGNPNWWFLRFYLTPKKKSFVTRLSIAEAKELAPEFEVQELAAPQGGAASRVVISSVNQLDQLTALIVKCYEVEAARHH